jgi:hypothetical protein
MAIMPNDPEYLILCAKFAWELVRHVPIDPLFDLTTAAVIKYDHRRAHWVYLMRGIFSIAFRR